MTEAQKMRLTPRPLDISLDQGFEGTDLFQYAAFGDRLALLYERIETPFVATLDGQWGSGKTTFARQWAGHLKKKGFPVIYFDAFKNDFQDDAFLVLAAEVAEVAQSEIGKGKKVTKAFLKGTKEVGKILLPVATKIAIRMATLGALSAKDMADLAEGTKALAMDASGALSESLEEAIEERLVRVESDRNAMESFKKTLSEIAESLSQKVATDSTENTASRPLIFIIDELDRCRPPFALNLLERIKHFYSVPGVAFLFVTNLKQLQASVRGAYGHESDALTYLDKFFELKFYLPETRNNQIGIQQRYVSHLFSSLGLQSQDRTAKLLEEGIQKIAEIHDLSLRSIERIMSNIALTFASTTDRQLRLAPVIVLFCFVRHLSPDLYRRIKMGQATYREVAEFMRFDDWKDAREVEWFEQWVRYVLDDEMSPDEVRELDKSLFRYNVGDRKDLIKITSAYIDELVIQQQSHL